MKKISNIFFIGALAIAAVACTSAPELGKEKYVIGRTSARSLGLKGPVSEVITRADFGELPFEVTLCFDKKGVLTAVDTLKLEEFDEGFDDEWRYDTTFNQAGLPSRVRYSFGEDVNLSGYYSYEYDQNGKLLEFSCHDIEDKLLSRDTYTYDSAGNKTSMKMDFSSGCGNYTYWNYDNDGKLVSSREYVYNAEGTQLVYADSTYIDSDKQKKHRYTPYYPTGIEGLLVMDSKDRVSAMNIFEQGSGVKLMEASFNYGKSAGVDSYTVTLYDPDGFASTEDVSCSDFDTFGNWIKTGSLEFIKSTEYDKDLVVIYSREIHYYGEDQGDMYSFSGKGPKGDISVEFQRKADFAQGRIAYKGEQEGRLVGYVKGGAWHFYGFTQTGGVLYTLEGRVQEGNFVGAISYADSPAREKVLKAASTKALPKYEFSQVPVEFPGIYRFKFQGEGPQGTLSVSRVGDDYEDFLFEIDCERAGEGFTDRFDWMMNGGEYYRYYYDEEYYFSYKVTFWDDWAVIMCTGKGENPTPVSPEGIYLRIPSVG
ncbi:MAG: hypothetical protein MJY67_02280 [Bacteroidales bacterium]|nr:hypothetical protein [Bacteroidales bacterium]